MKQTFLALVCLLMSFTGFAQSESSENLKTKVFLKNGSVLIAEYKSYDPNGDMVIILNGSDFIVPANEVKKIVMMESSTKVNINRLATKKVYHRTNFASLSNGNGNGISLNYCALYQHSRWLGVGLGVGIDNYYFTQGRNVYPLFAEFRSYLVDRNSSPYVSLKSGYGFIFSDEDLGQTKTRGGVLINPTFGYRFGSSGIMFDAYLGLRFQDAEYEFFDSWRFRQQDIQWNRVEIGFGISF